MYPKQLTKFRAWTKAMEANATVGTPDYGKSVSRTGSGVSQQRKRRKRRKKRKKRKDA